MAKFFDVSESQFKGIMTNHNIKEIIIPKYQRDYSWEEEHFSELWDDITEKAMKDEYFMGSVVFEPESTDGGVTYNGNVCVIDGQQRITTLCIICYLLRQKILNVKGNEGDRLRVALNEILYLNDADVPRLQHKEINSDDYRNLLKADIDNINKESRFYDAYRFYNEEIQKLDEANCINIAKAIINNLYFIKIEAKKNARQIFRTINHTGLDLRDADIIRAELLRTDKLAKLWEKIFDNEDKKEFWDKGIQRSTDNYLEDFFKQYLIFRHKGKFGVGEKNLNNYLKDIQGFSEQEVEKEFEQIKKFTKIYEQVRGEIEITNAPKFQSCVYAIKTLGWFIFMPLVFKAFDENKDAENFFENIENFMVRNFIRGSTMSAINKLWEPLFSNPINYLFDIDLSRTKYPSNHDLHNHYNDWNNAEATKFLRILEKKMQAKKNINLRYQRPSLEHIAPKKPKDTYWKTEENKYYINSIGNMMLLDIQKNKSVSNDTFKDKLDNKEYKRLILTFEHSKDIVDSKKWDVETVNARNKYLIQTAIEFYPDKKISNATN